MIDVLEQEKLRTRFNPDGSILRQHQLRMLEMLKYIDNVCSQHDIKYWLSSGTLLGAVRHGGFIPWDDDVDIEMSRKDYIKLINILKYDIKEGYALQVHSTDKNFFWPFAKIRDLNSVIVEPTKNGREKGTNYKYKGIYIDIFQLERNCVPLMKISERYMAVIHKLSEFKNDNLGIKYTFENILFYCFKWLIVPFFRLLAALFASKEKIYHTFGVPFFKCRIINDVFPLGEIYFEGFKFNSPNDSHSYLKRIYGENYMLLPELNSVKSHVNKIHFKS